MEISSQSTLLMEVLPAGSRHSLALDTIDAKAVADFTGELEQALRDLKKAFDGKDQVNQGLDLLQRELADRGWWGSLKANFSGSTDKELATMVRGLGASLGITQSVVGVMLKVLTQKNRLLYAFNDALVEKISKIQGDTLTLDSNQRVAALHFLGELQQQINEQIRHQELVDSHETRLSGLDQWCGDKDEREERFTEKVAHIDERLIAADAQVTILRDKVAALSGQVSHLNDQNASLISRTSVLEQQKATLASRTSTLEDQAAAQNRHAHVLEQRLALLEGLERKSRSTKAVVLRHLLPAIAFATAVASLLYSLHS